MSPYGKVSFTDLGTYGFYIPTYYENIRKVGYVEKINC